MVKRAMDERMRERLTTRIEETQGMSETQPVTTRPRVLLINIIQSEVSIQVT